jgi:hypothetical protein
VQTYFSMFREKVYTTFDWALRDEDGYYFILGRTDDVINVAGHRLGTREIEEAVQSHPNIAEVAVVGVADALKGQVPVAFAVVKDAAKTATPELAQAHERDVMATVDRALGAIGRPARIHFVQLLPKTRSGKLLRRSIQALAEGRDPGDLTTLEDPAALEQIKAALAFAQIKKRGAAALSSGGSMRRLFLARVVCCVDVLDRIADRSRSHLLNDHVGLGPREVRGLGVGDVEAARRELRQLVLLELLAGTGPVRALQHGDDALIFVPVRRNLVAGRNLRTEDERPFFLRAAVDQDHLHAGRHRGVVFPLGVAGNRLVTLHDEFGAIRDCLAGDDQRPGTNDGGSRLQRRVRAPDALHS